VKWEMKADEIREKLKKYHRKENDAILLEVIEGEPESEKGGLWIGMSVVELERQTEDPNFDKVASGLQKYLDKWQEEGLI